MAQTALFSICLLVSALFGLPFVSRADYPIASHRYLADPAGMVHDGRIYAYCSNDDDNQVAGGYAMKSIVCISSSDMKNWTDHGEVLRVPAGASWAGSSWAPAVVARNNQFYLYFGNGASGVGVATSASPTGPFTDPIGGSLINSGTPGTAGVSWIFDPAVFIDDDGQAYIYFGGGSDAGNDRVMRLNSDMTSVSGTAQSMGATNFFEAAWMHKRNGIYYLSYSTNPSNGIRIDYMTSTNPTNGFTYAGVAAGQPPSNNNNNHASIVAFNGNWYHLYHNRYVSAQAGIETTYRRNFGMEALTYNPDDTIQQVTYTMDGLVQLENLDPFVRVEAETMAAQNGIETEPCSEGGMNLTQIANGDWTMLGGVDFGAGATNFVARVASTAGGNIELRRDSVSGTLVGTCAVPVTGGMQTWADASCTVNPSLAYGVHDLYLVYTGGAGTNLFNVNGWQFSTDETLSPPVTTVALEAENGTLGADFASSGSNPAFITILTDGTANNPGSSARVATYSVTFPAAGTYDLYARIRTGVGTYNDDSMFAAKAFGVPSPTTDSDWFLLNGLAGVGYTAGSDVVDGAGSAQSQIWKWINLTDYSSAPGYTVSAETLARTFQIGAREDGLDIDKLVFGLRGTAFTVDELDNASTPPTSAPENLSAAPAGTSQIDLSWTASPDAASYAIKQSTTDGGPYTNIATGVAATSHSVMGLSPGTTYYYVVAAVNPGGEGPASLQAEATTALLNDEPPPAPENLSATAISETRIDLSWTTTPGATSYRVKRSFSGSGPFTTIAAGVSGSGYSDLGLSADTTYHYVVSAVNAFGESPDSTSASAATFNAFAAVEAESGSLGADFGIQGSNPTYITCTTDGSGNAPGNAARIATYNVTFSSAGTYELYARIFVGPGSFDDDSMFFANSFGTKSPTNDEDWTMVNGLAGAGYTASGDVVASGGSAGSQIWKWINLTQYAGTARLSVPPGGLTQTFQIGAREDGLNIDRLVFGKIGYPFTVDDLDNGTTPVLDIPIDSSVVDGAEIHQRIDGFGAGVVFLDGGLDPLSNANTDQLFGADAGQFGLSLLRIRISPSGNNAANLADAQKAVARGARVMASPWTPPASMKDNNALVGGSLLPSEYANYAAYLNNFAGYMKANGVELVAVSMQNEPDIEVSYESCDWTPEQIRIFCRDHAGVITNAPFMIAESFNFNKSVYDPTLNDPAAVDNVKVVGGHLYGTTVSDYPNARAKNKPIWMTEFLINDQSWATAMQTAEQIHDSLVTGNMSAYVWWKTIGNANGLLNAAGAPQKRGYMMGQFSRFVRPDSYRIGVDSAGAAKVSAYKNAAGDFSIVAVNHSVVDVGQTFSLTNCFESGTLVPWITSSNLSLAVQSPVSVTDSSFSYVLPAMSVVTFTGQIDDPDLNRASISSVSGSGVVLVTGNGISGLDYVLESTDDLVDSTWTPTWINTADAAGSVVFTNTPTGPQQFYRIRSDSFQAHPTYP